MGTHIVRAFKGMDEVGSTVGNEFIKKRLKVMPIGKEKVISLKTERNVMSLSRTYVNGTKEGIIKKIQESQSTR